MGTPFRDIISDITEKALGTLNKPTKICRLGIKPSKKELMHFSRITKIPDFKKPRLEGTELQALENYLGVILDRKNKTSPIKQGRRIKPYTRAGKLLGKT